MSSDLLPQLDSGLQSHANSSFDDPSSLLDAWDDLHGVIQALYNEQSKSPSAREELSNVPYQSSWQVVVQATVNALGATLQYANEHGAAHTKARFQSLTRLILLFKNLCLFRSFQLGIRQHFFHMKNFGPFTALVEFLAQPQPSVDVKPCMKALLQLCLNTLTIPENESASSVYAIESALSWGWVRDGLFPHFLKPLLENDETIFLFSCMAAGIVHHALLSGHISFQPDADLHPSQVQATREFFFACSSSTASSPPSSQEQQQPGTNIILLLEGALKLVAEEIEEMDEQAEETEQAAREEAERKQKKYVAHPTSHSVWDWKPLQEEQPFWFLEILSFLLRSEPTCFEHLENHPKMTREKWNLLVRCVEVIMEKLQDNMSGPNSNVEKIAASLVSDHAANASSDASASADSAKKLSQLEVCAPAITGNAVTLIKWLQKRERVPLPVSVLPPSNHRASSDASSSSSSSPASAVPAVQTDTIPLDACTNAILNSVGHMLLHRTWDQTLVFFTLRDALFKDCALHTTLLHLLEAADVLDGGSMFSELYTPVKPGYTRHTKESDNDKDYVNQFKSEEEKAAAARATSASSTPPAASAPPKTGKSSTNEPRKTPYLLKSNIIRLIASMSFQCEPIQSAFGAPTIYTCMNHSVLDEHNPLMKEYAVLALRNLLQDHSKNQEIVAELRVDGMANQAQLREIGVDTQLDPDTGKIRIKNLNTKPQP